MNNKISKAVFPVAGFGTRFLPVTKTMPKELLPIINKPLIQYAVEDALAAGCKKLIFITGQNKGAIEDYFTRNIDLEKALCAIGKNKEAQLIKNVIPENVEFIFIRQTKQLGLGHAVLCAQPAVQNEPFLVLLADDFLISEGTHVTKNLINSFQKTGKCQISAIEVDQRNVSKYGIIDPEPNTKGVRGLIEKPSLDRAPSNLASIGRYLLTAEIFQILENQQPGYGNEIQLADSLNQMAINGDVERVMFKGQRFDCGSFEGYLEAINTEAQNLVNK